AGGLAEALYMAETRGDPGRSPPTFFRPLALRGGPAGIARRRTAGPRGVRARAAGDDALSDRRAHGGGRRDSRTAASMYRPAGPVYCTAAPVYRTAGPLYGTADRMYRTPTAVPCTAAPVYCTASPLYRTAGPVYRTAGPLYRTAEPVDCAPVTLGRGCATRPRRCRDPRLHPVIGGRPPAAAGSS